MEMSSSYKTPEPEKIHRPTETKFHRQELPAWQPVLRARSVYPFFLLVGVIFMCLGAVLVAASYSVSEVTILYTHCVMENSTTKCSDEVERPSFFSRYQTCKCRVFFKLSSPMEGKVFMYYGLSNFYQNHRFFVKSRDNYQLIGRDESSLEINCEPYRTIKVIIGNTTVTKNIAPCGAVANSIFNDTFKLFYYGENDSEYTEIGLLKKGITWTSDKYLKFGIPSNESWAKTHKPIAWPKPAYERASDAYRGDEDFQVWMRPAAFPSFRKLYRRIDHKSNDKFKTGLPKGKYELEVQYAYPVTSFGSEKKVILSTTSWMGGRNPWLGICYLVVGFIQTVCGFIFLALHMHAKKRTLEIMVVDGKITYRTSVGYIEPRPINLSSFNFFQMNLKDTMNSTNVERNKYEKNRRTTEV